MQTTYFPFCHVYLKSWSRVNEVKNVWSGTCASHHPFTVCVPQKTHSHRKPEQPISDFSWDGIMMFVHLLSYYCLVGFGYYGKQTSVKLDAKFRASFKWELYPFSAEVCQQKTDNTSHLHSTLTKIGMYVVLCWKDVLVTVLILVGQRWKLEEPFWEASSRGRTALWDYSWGPPNRVVAGQVVIFAL